jgi:GTPase Era involved in 16S rRNA processing
MNITEKYKDCLNIAEVYLEDDHTGTVYLCANYSHDLNIGDVVLVSGEHSKNRTLWVAVVNAIYERNSEVALKHGQDTHNEVACICNMAEFNMRCMVRKIEADKAKHRKQLLKQMAERAEKVDQMHRFRILAEHDDEMSELLRQLDKLDNPGDSHGTEEA